MPRAITCQSLLPCCSCCLTACCSVSFAQDRPKSRHILAMLITESMLCSCMHFLALITFQHLLAVIHDLLMQRGPAQHVARYGGNVGSEIWSFWVDLQACTLPPSHAPQILLTIVYVYFFVLHIICECFTSESSWAYGLVITSMQCLVCVAMLQVLPLALRPLPHRMSGHCRMSPQSSHAGAQAQYK